MLNDDIGMPTKEQIKEYIEYVNNLELISNIHGLKFENLPKEEQKELQTVGKWLNAISKDA